MAEVEREKLLQKEQQQQQQHLQQQKTHAIIEPIPLISRKVSDILMDNDLLQGYELQQWLNTVHIMVSNAHR